MIAPEDHGDYEDDLKPRGRPKTGARQISVWIPAWINEELVDRALKEKTSKSKLVVRYLERMLARAKPEGEPKI